MSSTEVKLYLESCDDPDSLNYMECPTCGSVGKLMVIPMDEGGHKYTCLRATCDTWGYIGGTYRPKAKEETESKRKIYTPYDVQPLAEQRRCWLEQKFELEDANDLCAGVHRDDYGEFRYVFPIRDPVNMTRGYVDRSFKNKQYKALLRPYHKTGPVIAWYGHRWLYDEDDSRPVLIVEDQISACRAGADFPTIALLGTSLRQEALPEIIKHCGRRRIVVVLDNDAVKTGLRIARAIPNGNFFPLFGEDIKDMPEQEYFDLVSTLLNGQ